MDKDKLPKIPSLNDLKMGKEQVNITLQSRAYNIVKNYLKSENVTFSAVIDQYVKDLAKEVEKIKKSKKS